jgi:diguanylate cyclase (GGDEF)-like protein
VPRAREAGADLFLLRPHSRDSLVTVLQAAAAVQTERRAARAQQATADGLRQRLLRYGQADAVTGFQHFDFFEHLLVMELKRARRYGYPLAVCLVANDPWERKQAPPAEAARTLRTRVAAAITACIRDIDVPVDFAEDRFLVFLPYTDIDGAELVGRRVAQVVKSQGSVSDGDKRWRMSVSVGIAATRPGAPLSFAKLMRDASAAVRAAQLKGGGRVVVRR